MLLVSGLHLVMCGALLFVVCLCDLYKYFELLSSKIRGIHDFQKREIIFTWNRTQKPDIPFCQKQTVPLKVKLNGSYNDKKKMYFSPTALIAAE